MNEKDTDAARVKAAQSLKAFMENQPMLKQLATALATDAHNFYMACTTCGFSPEQALHLTAARLQGASK